MTAIYDSLDSVPFHCYFSGTVAELKKFISEGIYFEDIYRNEEC